MDVSESPAKRLKCQPAAAVNLDLASLASEDDAVSRQLLAAGMDPSDLAAKQKLFAAAAKRLQDEGLAPESAAKAYWVPGRIEVAGKHTDYAGGRSLLVATTRGFAAVSVDREDDKCRIFTTLGRDHERKSTELAICGELEPTQGHWSAYPAVAIRRLARNFGIEKGVDVALERDLPESSGMSSSSAVICLMWMILSDRNELRESQKFKDNLKTPEELYSYLGFIENGQDCGTVLVGDKGVGTFGGSEDHTAIMSCKAGKMNLFSYCPTKNEGTFVFPSSLMFVIAVTGALAEKTGDAMADYNNAAFLARDAATAWCDSTGGPPLGGSTFVPGRANLAEVVRHVRGRLSGETDIEVKVRMEVGQAIAKVDDGASYGPNPDVRYRKGALRERFEQFFDESEQIVAQLAKAIAAEDAAEIGRLSDESHRQTVECLRNTIPETAWLPKKARELGAVGASAFGAGFGGSCWALCAKEDAQAFMEKWKTAYKEQFPRWADTCTFFCGSCGPGALVIS